MRRTSWLTAPSKGLDETSSKGIPYRVGTIDKMKYTDLKLMLLDTEFYKDMIYGRLNRETGARGSFNVFEGVPRQYADQLCSEHKVTEYDRARTREAVLQANHRRHRQPHA